MMGWNVFTWLCSIALGAAAVVIFVFFLRDARAVISGEGREHDAPEE